MKADTVQIEKQGSITGDTARMGKRDPDLTAAIRSAMVDVKEIATKRAGYRRPFPKLPPVKNPLAKYPLFSPQHFDHEHLYLYLNAAYAADKE